ncbi:epimerase/hydratase [Purpureocillium lavendulum]|uniref:Epimerase/hydratase n=1 Tax=Purpureocillium lavendulum TaxID=1247861 RepID=A0AB34FSD2_9HYPO|nr:epimerase/hydratase [Purpureocillium lavendulum]
MEAHYLDIWCELEGLALYWDCGAGDFSMCDDPERGAELVGLVGFMVLATLQELKKRDVLTPSNRIPNLGYILSIMICCGWNRGRELSDEYMDCVPWVYRVMDVAHEAGIVIAGARGYERVAEEIGSEEADGKTPELVKKWEKSVFSTKKQIALLQLDHHDDMTLPVAFIIGGGPRIGHAVAAAFVKDGYRVALGRRNLAASEGLPGVTPVAVDVSNPSSVETAFAEVEGSLGVPSVVVYNAAALTFPPEQGDPFSVPPDAFTRDTAVNVASGYAALHYATRAWKKTRQGGAGGVFIATGNVTPFYPNPFATTLGAGKAGLVHLIQIANQELKDGGDRFYFVSQVTEEGNPVRYEGVEAAAHGQVYSDIVKGGAGKSSWDVRFSVGKDGSIAYQKG